jgi:hypothetical protein
VAYKTEKGKVIYLTGSKIVELLWKAVKKVHPDTTPDELKRYSAHSLRVWACVLPGKAGKLPDYINKRLCWLGDSFRMYLRDTAIIQHKHVAALLAALQEVMDLITALPKGRRCPVYYDGGNGQSRHAQIPRQNGLSINLLW